MPIDNVILETEEKLDHTLERHRGTVMETYSRSYRYNPAEHEVMQKGERIKEEKNVYCSCGEEFGHDERELGEHIKQEQNPNKFIGEHFEGEVATQGFELHVDGATGNLRWDYTEGELPVMVYATVDYDGVINRENDGHYIHFQAMTSAGVEVRCKVVEFDKPFTPRTYFLHVRDFIENTF